MSRPSVVENADGPFLTAADMRWFWAQYVPEEQARLDPSVNLGEAARLGELEGLAPAVVATAELDPLRDEGLAHAEALAAAGVTVSLLHGAGLVHGYFGLGSVSAAARAEGDRALDALLALLGYGADGADGADGARRSPGRRRRADRDLAGFVELSPG